MINEIIKGIADAIYQEFGNDYEIYDEEVEQGLNEPCFFVYCINPQNNIFLGRRRIITNQFAIQYIAKGPNKKAEINDVFDRLNSAIEFISVSGIKLMVTNVTTNIENGVLTVNPTYKFFAYKEAEGDIMEEQTMNQEVKEHGR